MNWSPTCRLGTFFSGVKFLQDASPKDGQVDDRSGKCRFEGGKRMTPAKPERSTGTARNSNAEFSTIYDFGAKFEEGNTPNGRLIMDASGKLYGVTINGGITTDDGLGHGVVFMLVPEGAASGGTYQYHVLHKFAGGPSEGARPVG